MLRQASLQLETLVRRALGGVGRGAMHIADADYIEQGGAHTAVVAALAPYYVNARYEVQDKIDKFLQMYNHSNFNSYEDYVYTMTIELRKLYSELGIVLEKIK